MKGFKLNWRICALIAITASLLFIILPSIILKYKVLTYYDDGKVRIEATFKSYDHVVFDWVQVFFGTGTVDVYYMDNIIFTHAGDDFPLSLNTYDVSAKETEHHIVLTSSEPTFADGKPYTLEILKPDK